MTSTYADRISGISTSTAVKAPVRVATTANITLSGLQTIDGVSLAANDRVLVKDQTNAVDNGIWVASTSAWTRARDFDGSRDVARGTLVLVAEGSNPRAMYRVTSDNPVTIGTDNITFERVDGGLFDSLTALNYFRANAAGDGVEQRTPAQVRGDIGFDDGGFLTLDHTHTYASSTSTTVSGDVTEDYKPGRRVRAVGSATGTIYGEVSSSSHSGGTTTVNYTWDSGSLSNESLTVSVGQASPTGRPIDGDAVNFLQSGTGAVTRSAQDRLREVVSVKDFGAVGDGVTDDLTAVQAAIDALPNGGEVSFPDDGGSVYFVSSKPTVSSGVRITFVFHGAARLDANSKYPKGASILGFSQQGTETSYHEVYVVDDDIDQIAIAGSKVNGFSVFHGFGGANATGGRHAIYGVAALNSATAATNTDRNYVGVQGHAIAYANDGGTALTAADAAGAIFGASSIAVAESGATYLKNVTGFEANTQVKTGASVWLKTGVQAVSKDDVQGVKDAAFAVGASSTSVKWNYGVLFTNANGGTPIDATGTLVGVDHALSVSKGIDFGNVTFSGPTFNSKTFVVNGSTLDLGSAVAANSPAVDFRSSGNNNDYDARIIGTGGGGSSGAGALTFQGGAFAFNALVRPSADNSTTLGAASFRWSEVFAATGTINTSDAREKTPLRPLTEAETRVAIRLSKMPGIYQFLSAIQEKGEGARLHMGVIAQEVQDAFEAEGLDGFAYGVLCHDTWEAQEARYDEHGNEVLPAVGAGSRYGIRYDELSQWQIAGLNARLAAAGF